MQIWKIAQICRLGNQSTFVQGPVQIHQKTSQESTFRAFQQIKSISRACPQAAKDSQLQATTIKKWSKQLITRKQLVNNS